MYGQDAEINRQADYFAVKQGEGKPLSMEITDRTQWAVENTRSTLGRLCALRDRLYGSVPTASNNAAQPQRASDCFASAWRNLQDELEANLAAIDSLSSEIANRF